MKVATTCLLALGATLCLCPLAHAGMKAAKPTPEAEDSKAMYEVQAHLRVAEDKISRLKDDAAKTNPADRINEDDRAAAKKEAAKELSAASQILGGVKGKLDATKARDFQQRIAAARKDLGALDKPAAPKK